MQRLPLRSGFLHTGWLAALGTLVLLGCLVGLLVWQSSTTAARDEPVTVYCAAALRIPVEAVARAYEKETGVPVHVQYGASQTLLTNLEVARSGDLYLPADDSYAELARQKGLAAEALPAIQMSPVLAVQKGNPQGITSLTDLLSKKLRVSQANSDAAAVGKLTRDLLRKTGQWDALKQRTTVFKPTVNDVANDLKVGAVDAGIVWDATVQQYPELERVETPEFAGQSAHASVVVLNSTTQPAAALRFARYLTARDRGLPHFVAAGFKTIQGDEWAQTPEIQLLSGAMLRPAIEETITAFEEREGVQVTRVYNGCGILVAQMKAGQKPDAYFACDKSFMEEVTDLFLDPADISTNQLVIMVHQGNPHQIHKLEDLAKPGLKVGIGHEKQCALGVLTQRTLKESKLQSPVMKNVAVQSPTGDLLVNQLRTKSLDAIIAYISNAASAGAELESIPVDIPCAIAIQPMAVGKESRYPNLTQRLMNEIRTQASREKFEKNGFRWVQPETK